MWDLMTDRALWMACRFRVALAIAIIRSSPKTITPEVYANQLCNAYRSGVIKLTKKMDELEEQTTHFRQKLIESHIKTKESLCREKRGRKRKNNISERLNSNTHEAEGFLCNNESSKRTSEDICDTVNAPNFKPQECHTHPNMAFEFLKVFLTLNRHAALCNTDNLVNQEEKISLSIQAVHFLIDEVFWIAKTSSLKNNSNLLSTLSADSYDKILKTVGDVVESLFATPTETLKSSNLHDLMPVAMLRRIIERIKGFVWNFVNCSNIGHVTMSWKGVLDRLLSASKCGLVMKCCLCKALVELISHMCHQLKVISKKDHLSSLSPDSTLESAFGSHVLVNSAYVFSCLERIVASPFHQSYRQPDIANSILVESRKQLDHSLLHILETYPLFALRVWEVAGLLEESITRKSLPSNLGSSECEIAEQSETVIRSTLRSSRE